MAEQEEQESAQQSGSGYPEQPGQALPAAANGGGDAATVEALLDLRREIAGQAARESAASKAVEYLSAELDVLKRQQSAASMRPLLLDLLRIVDRMEGELAQAGNPQLEEYRDEFLEALRRFEVTALEDPAADGFNPELHLALRTIPTTNEASGLQVAEVLRKGYRHRRAILRPAEVAIYKFRAPSASQI